MRRSSWVVCLLAALLSGCSATKYEAAKNSGDGHGANEIEPARWRITFSGNGHTTQETVQTYWLYRCAELTLEQGYQAFEVVSNTRLVEAPPIDPLLHRVKDDKRKRRPEIVIEREVERDVYIRTNPTFVVGAEIRLLKSPVEADPPRVFDAAALKATLEPLVKGKKCERDNVCPHVHRYLYPDDRAGPLPPPAKTS